MPTGNFVAESEVAPSVADESSVIETSAPTHEPTGVTLDGPYRGSVEQTEAY